MDWDSISKVVGGILGGGGLAGAATAWWKDRDRSRERSEKRQDDKFWKLFDKQGEMLEALQTQAKAQEQETREITMDLAVAKAALGTERELRGACQKQLDELSARFASERDECETRITALEAELKALRSGVSIPTPPPLWPPHPKQQEDTDYAGNDANAG